MPGRFWLTRAAGALVVPQGAGAPPEQAPRRNIAPGQEVLTLTPVGWVMARWGLIPSGRTNARGRPVMETIVNARSETVFDKSAFAGVAPAVVPADGWYEWTGQPRAKTAWAISRRDGAPLWFAAISDAWTAPGGRQIVQVATVTCPPSPDVAAIHDRMGVILEPAQIPVWLDGGAAAKDLLRPLGAGMLDIREIARDGWEDGP